MRISTFLKLASIIIASALWPLVQSCSEDDAAAPQTEVRFENKYEVEYSDNVKIFDGASLIEYDTVNCSTYRLDASKIDKEISAGDIIIITGKALRKVMDISSSEGVVTLETEDAPINEAIKNGVISWEHTPTLDAVAGIMSPGADKCSVNKILDGYQIVIEVGNWKFTIWMNPAGLSPSGQQEIQLNLIAENGIKTEGTTKVSAIYGAKGIVRLPKQATAMKFANNETTSFETKNKGSYCELKMEYEAVLSQGGGTAVLTLPEIVMRIPIQAFGISSPIPISLDYGIKLTAYVNVPSVTAGVSGYVKFSLDSDNGFKMENKLSPEATSKVNNKDLTEINFDIGDNSIAPAPVAMRYDVVCPRVGLNICGSEVVWLASVFRAENMMMVPSLCKAAFYQMRIDCGYKLAALGVTFAEDSKVVWDFGKELKTEDCP